MTDAYPLLRAIIESPADDSLRLVFADWLEEHGQAAHAEFVRLQCERARLPEGAERRQAIWRREDELFALVLEWQWREELAALALYGLGLDDFERGFLSRRVEVNIAAEEFVRRAGRWTFLLAIDRLRVSGPPTEAELFASPHPGRVLDLDCLGCGVTDGALQPLATAEHLGLLNTLNLRCNNVGPAGITTLARCPSLTGLTGLLLGANPVGDDGVVALTRARALKNLTHLDLSETGLGDPGAVALAGSPGCRSLTRLWLGGNRIGDAGVIALANSPHLASVESLDLANNPFGTAGVEALAASPYLTQLQSWTSVRRRSRRRSTEADAGSLPFPGPSNLG